MQLLFLGTLALFAGLSVAVPAQEKRIHHKLDLSDHAHDDAHGFQFDHEAFLGKEESKTFDQLSPEESKDRLGYTKKKLEQCSNRRKLNHHVSYFCIFFIYSPCRKIVDKIDTDKDGFVSHAELHHWIKHRQRRYIEENVDKHWNEYDQNKDGKIGWIEYKNTTYGYYIGNEALRLGVAAGDV